MTERYLILEDGSAFKGEGFGSGATTTGQVVFNTSMTGYQQIVTNQIYHNQIIVFFLSQRLVVLGLHMIVMNQFYRRKGYGGARLSQHFEKSTPATLA